MNQVHGGAMGGDGDIGGDLLDDLDSYLEDINARLTVSRMVSDAVTRGIVAAIQQESAAEIFSSKEAATAAAVELALLKKTVPSCNSLLVVDSEEEKNADVQQQKTVSNGTISICEMSPSDWRRQREVVVELKEGRVKNSVQQQDAKSNGIVSVCQVSPSDWGHRPQMDVDVEAKNSLQQHDVMVNGMCQVSPSDWRQRQGMDADVECGRAGKPVQKQEAVSNCMCQVSLSDWIQRQEVGEEEELSEPRSFIRHVLGMREELSLIVQSLSFLDHGSALSPQCGAEGRHCQGWDSVPKTVGLEPSQLKGMTKEELLKYINEEMSEMRRTYESQFHRLTDDYFFQKRTRDRGPALLRNKDRDLLDISREKVSQVLSKLDSFIFEHMTSLAHPDTIKSFLSENRRLRAEIEEREEETAGENELFRVILGDFYELILAEAVSEIEELMLESILGEEVEAVVLRGAAEGLRSELEVEKEARVYLEKRGFEGEKALRWMKEEMEEQEARFGVAVGELQSLREQVREQEGEVARGVREAGRMREEQEVRVRRIVEACDQHVRSVKEKLELSDRELRESREERGFLNVLLGDTRREMEATRAEDVENRLRLEAVIRGADRLLRMVSSFETWVVDTVWKSVLRLENSKQELSMLVPKADNLTKKSLLLNKSLRVKRDEHMKAERDVALLAEEVVSLSSLLHKIYTALNHYSPILHHYPGVMEILKLIRREIGNSKGHLKKQG